MMKLQESSQTKFLWTVAMLEVMMMAIYVLLVRLMSMLTLFNPLLRYDDSADPVNALKSWHSREDMRFLLLLKTHLLPSILPQI